MDNATEALLIAGGILLGILTITALVYMFNNLSIMGNAKIIELDKETRKIELSIRELEGTSNEYKESL